MVVNSPPLPALEHITLFSSPCITFHSAHGVEISGSLFSGELHHTVLYLAAVQVSGLMVEDSTDSGMFTYYMDIPITAINKIDDTQKDITNMVSKR